MNKPTMQWAYDNKDSINLIDVRTPAEHQVRGIKGIMNFPISQLIETPEKFIQKDVLYYTHCGSGGRAAKAAEELVKKGYNVIPCVDGIKSIKLDGE